MPASIPARGHALAARWKPRITSEATVASFLTRTSQVLRVRGRTAGRGCYHPNSQGSRQPRSALPAESARAQPQRIRRGSHCQRIRSRDRDARRASATPDNTACPPGHSNSKRPRATRVSQALGRSQAGRTRGSQRAPESVILDGRRGAPAPHGSRYSRPAPRPMRCSVPRGPRSRRRSMGAHAGH